MAFILDDEGAADIFDWLKEWLYIYTWVELWIIVGSTVLMISTWLLFGLLLQIQNTIIRTVSIWSLIFGLTAGAATTNWITKRRRDGTS